MGRDFIGADHTDEPDGSVDWNRLYASSCTPTKSAAVTVAGGRGEHDIKEFEALEAMWDGILHESVKWDGWIGEIHEELKALGIVVSDTNGDPEGSFSIVTFAFVNTSDQDGEKDEVVPYGGHGFISFIDDRLSQLDEHIQTTAEKVIMDRTMHGETLRLYTQQTSSR